MLQLVNVSKWVYNLFKVTYWTGDPAAGGREISSTFIASSSDDHMLDEAWENPPNRAVEYVTWVVVKENVGDPRIIGSMYGQPIYEAGIAYGRRLAEQM